MKYTFTLLISFALFGTCLAKKASYPLELIAGMADLIAVGKIEQVNSGSYQFRIEKSIKGDSKEIISVSMFKEWTCDVRWKKPVKGQELLLFLKKKGISIKSSMVVLENDL